MSRSTRGVGKCENGHTGSFGYPTRPDKPYNFCSQCGQPIIWECPKCGDALPQDSEELAKAQFCRQCGAAYFGDGQDGSAEKTS